MTPLIEYEIRCEECEYTAFVDRQKIESIVEDEIMLPDDDYDWIHVYYFFCPICERRTSVEILSDNHACRWYHY